MLAGSIKFVVELKRAKGEAWGFDLTETMQIKQIDDSSVLAIWNWWHPSLAVVLGDQVVEVNGFSNSKGILDTLKVSNATRILLARHGAIASTFSIKLVKTSGMKLGMKLNDDFGVIKIDVSGTLAAWNASNPLLSVHLGDRILQAGQLASSEKICERLQFERELDLLVGRMQRRFDAASGLIRTYMECQIAYPDADSRWANMQVVPDVPDQGFPTHAGHFLENEVVAGDNRPLLASESFYRTFTKTNNFEHSTGTCQNVHRV